MANAKTAVSITTKQSLLPPRIPVPSSAPLPYNAASCAAWQQQNQRPHHQRTSSESFVAEEQPSWLDDLLNEPESPVQARRGNHRRSSSDSFAAFFDPSMGLGPNSVPLPNKDFVPRVGNSPITQWGSLDKVNYPNAARDWDAPSLNFTGYGQRPGNGVGAMVERVGRHMEVGALRDYEVPFVDGGEWRSNENGSQDLKMGAVRVDGAHANHFPQSEAETKRAKQQYAQRSRVRKLQYIAELESRVQALEADELGFAAEIDYLGEQNIMLGMENEALKQRLESLAQEQRIKRYQQEMFEREIARLRSIYRQQQQLQQQQQQQQQQQHSPTTMRLSSSKDLDTQFSNLSLKSKDTNSKLGWDPMCGSIRI